MSGGDGTYHAYVERGSEAPAFEVAAALKNLDWEPALTPQKRKLRFRTQKGDHGQGRLRAVQGDGLEDSAAKRRRGRPDGGSL